MASKSIARELVKINIEGNESEQFKIDALKAEDLLVNDIADSTGEQYGPQWVKFREYCDINNHESLPSLPETIVVYLSSIAEEGLGSVYMARASIRYFHRKFNSSSSSPTDDTKVKSLFLALKRKLSKPVTKLEPISNNILEYLINNWSKPYIFISF